jgi:polysaccharide export outer membrane protein
MNALSNHPVFRARAPWLLLGILSLALTGRSEAQTAAPTQLAVAHPEGVALRPGDEIRLKIWREPDLSGDFQVDEQGSVVFPKIGVVQVTAFTSDSLTRFLVGSYSVYLRNPSIDVTLLRRVNVLGSVKNPGLYPVDPTMTIADAVALAGGATSDGKTNKIELIRGGDRIKTDMDQQTRLADSPIRSGDQLYIPQRSWVSRNGWLVGSLITATAVVVAATMR